MNNSTTITNDLLIFVSGFALVILSKLTSLANYPLLVKVFESVGLSMVGYGPIRFFLYFISWISEYNTRRSIEKLMKSSVRIISRKSLPIFIATDVEGCLTPPNRTEIDLRKFQRLRQYCQFVKENHGYPQLVIFTGRSQGYVEFLAQSLNMHNCPRDLPFVIENGSALYHIDSKRTESLVDAEQRSIIVNTRVLLHKLFPNNEFEPKSYIVTINPIETQTIDELREQITLMLEANHLIDKLTISSTASAVDIAPKGITKITGFEKVLRYYSKDGFDQSVKSVVAIGDSISDIEILKRVGSGYCPAENVHAEVRKFVEKKFGSDHVVNLRDIDFVINVVERECGLRLL
ncbi:MAG TPA: HAD hydrolase family protein [Chitinispirillaceae bacterium]|nr:HAD hydrolase family protein [Chitinispirillaceae bacterium]